MAHEIAMRKADIAGLEQEAATLTNEIRRSKGKGVDVLSKQLCNVNVMIGKHQDTVAELEARSEVQVKVKVKRVRTCVELLKTETSSEDQEVKMISYPCSQGSSVSSFPPCHQLAKADSEGTETDSDTTGVTKIIQSHVVS
eukprot:g70977.t1